MYKAMKALAIAVLLLTVIGAGAALYAVRTLSPVVEQTVVRSTPAADAQDVYETAVSQVLGETFTGRVFAQADGMSAQDCTFLTYTLRLANRGFFPAEWISLEMHPAEGDVLQLDNYQANVLTARSRGDISATILHRGDASALQRAYTVTCYVFGRKITLQGTAQ